MTEIQCRNEYNISQQKIMLAMVILNANQASNVLLDEEYITTTNTASKIFTRNNVVLYGPLSTFTYDDTVRHPVTHGVVMNYGISAMTYVYTSPLVTSDGIP